MSLITLKEIKGIISSLPDNYKFMIRDDKGATYWAKIEIDTKNDALIVGR